MTTAPIVELGAFCDDQIGQHLGWFETLGRWLRDEPDGARQRLWATASHRHAWHAELWRDRRPTIPPVADRDPPIAVAVADDVDVDARVRVYAEAVDALRHALTDFGYRIDADLDPATRRVIDLVDADLTDLRRRLTGRD